MRPVAQPSASNGAAEPLKPAVDPAIVNFIKTFKNQVIAQVAKRFPQAEAIAMSVINRGIGLATESMVSGHESVENIVFGVFEQAKAKYPHNQLLEPKLIEALAAFKAGWVETLKPKLGQQKAEALLLSAIDRVLDFADKSIMHPASDMERLEFEDAENLLMPLIRKQVEEYRKSMAPGR